MKSLTEREKLAHILRRFGLGASEAELDYYGKNGVAGAIDLLLNYESADSGFSLDVNELQNRQGVINIRAAQGYWYLRFLVTLRPLEEKMTLFWHNHFATSAQKVDSSFAMLSHVDQLRAYALGNFKDLLLAISKDPAMIYWLDNHENLAGKPNENFAREVMELFTLGIGNYTEKDIQEAARAFTGWTFGGRFNVPRRPGQSDAPRRIDKFRIDEANHDKGTKTIFGKSDDFSGEDVLALLCKNPQTSKYIAEKMWRWFAYDNPDSKLIDKLAQKFFDSGLEIKALVRAILESPEFYSEACVRKQIKTPIEFAVSTARQLGAGQIAAQRVIEGRENPQMDENQGFNVMMIRALTSAFAVRSSTKSMGMELMYPPDVSGWRTGDYWITTSTMMERIKWADLLFAGTDAPARPAQNLGGNAGLRRGGPNVGINAFGLFASNPTPAGVVEALVSIFDASPNEAQRTMLLTMAEKTANGPITPRNAGEVARQVSRLLFSTPEFQLC